MTFSEALYSHISQVAAAYEARVYAVSAPAADAATSPVVVIAFEGGAFTSMDLPMTSEETYTITAVSANHLEAVTLARTLALDLNAFAGVMGGGGGVDVIKIEAAEGPEDYDIENSLFARNVSLSVTYEF